MSAVISAYDYSLPHEVQQRQQQAYEYPDNVIRLPFQSLSDAQASKIVLHDYENFSNYRYQNHDWRWVIADTLFTGWKPTRYWEGTKIPMSSLAVMVAFEQIESFVPEVMDALFEDPQWFDTDPMRGTTPDAARVTRDMILAQLQESHPFWQCFETVKSAGMYGNGIMMSGWEYSVNKLLQFIPTYKPITRTVVDPRTGKRIQMPTGQYKREIRQNLMDEDINRPIMRYVPLRHCFVDPNAPSPFIREHRAFIHVSYMSVDELDALRKQPGFESMPDKYALLMLAHQKPNEQMDQTLAEMEAARRSSWTPVMDQSTDPAAARVKVVHYYTRDRVIWQLNGTYLCYNRPNPIGEINYYGIPYATLLDRFYAMGICDVIESEQRVQEGLINGRLNELALALHPTTVRNRGSSTPVYQLRVRPGAIADSNDPKNDVVRQYPTNATQLAHLEAQASDIRAQRRTGITGPAMSAIGTSTNPLGRTAAGANLQGRAQASRIKGFVTLFEILVLEPMLTDVHEWNRRFLDPNQMMEALNGEQIDPIHIFGAKVKFAMRAGARMQAKQSLLAMVGPAMQTMMNPLLIEQMHSIGKTPNLIGLMKMFMDASGYHNRFEWLTDLTEKEQQMLNKPDPNMIKAQMQDKRMAALKDMQTSRDEMSMFKELIGKLADAHLNDIYTDTGDDENPLQGIMGLLGQGRQ